MFNLKCKIISFSIQCFLFLSKGASDKVVKQFESQISDLNAELEKSQRALAEMTNNKTKFEREAAELMKQLEDAESNVSSFSKEKSRLAQQLEEARQALEDETRV